MAAPSVRATSGTLSGTTQTSITIAKPAGTASGDVLIAVIANGGASTEPTTVPSGWSLLDSASITVGGTSPFWGGLYYLVAGGSEPANYTWSGATDSVAGCMIAIQGADTGSPFDVHTVRANSDPATGTASITTTVADTLVVGAEACDDNRSLGPWACATDPATLTEQIEYLSSGGADTGSGIATASKAATGATGTFTVTFLGGADNVGFLLAVKPPAGGQSVAVGTATEADSAIALGRVKTRVAGTAAETDTAVGLARVKARAVGRAAETDSAIALGRVKRRTLGVAGTTDTAFALGRLKTKAVGTAAETDAARPVTSGGAIPVGTATESDSAFTLGRRKARTIGLAAETDSATSVGRAKARAVGTAVEIDTALPIGTPASGMVVRPDTGRTTRPDSGLVVRPFTGRVTYG